MKSTNTYIHNEIIKQAISEVIAAIDENEEPVGYAFITALNEYFDRGYKLSDLSWFKGTILVRMDNLPLNKNIDFKRVVKERKK